MVAYCLLCAALPPPQCSHLLPLLPALPPGPLLGSALLPVRSSARSLSWLCSAETAERWRPLPGAEPGVGAEPCTGSCLWLPLWLWLLLSVAWALAVRAEKKALLAVVGGGAGASAGAGAGLAEAMPRALMLARTDSVRAAAAEAEAAAFSECREEEEKELLR